MGGYSVLSYVYKDNEIDKMPSKTALEITPSKWRDYRPFKFNKEQKSASSSVSEALDVAKSIANELINRFGSKKVVLFGSLARGDFNRRSDIDLAVRDIPPGDFYKAVAFASGFSSVWRVDIVDLDDCTEALRDIILQEGVEL
jgi:predicted nucleotidyltransferase